MRRAGWAALVVVVCTPMLLSMLLLLMVTWPKMDGFTQKMPVGMKAAIAGAIVRLNRKSDAATVRAEKLDQAAARIAEAAPDRVFGQAAPPFDPVMANEAAELELDKKATRLVEQHDYCAAEDVYTKAASRANSQEAYWHTQGMGRAALACGDLVGARAGLETSLEMSARYLKTVEGETPQERAENDEEDVQETKDDILEMHELLVVVYDRQKEKKLSAESCKLAHPDWKKCGCSFKGMEVSCVEKK